MATSGPVIWLKVSPISSSSNQQRFTSDSVNA
jgi:hypothetical protein